MIDKLCERISKDDFNYESNVILNLIKNDFFVTMSCTNEFINLINKDCDVTIDNRYDCRS